MRKYQFYRSEDGNHYAISDYGKRKIDFATIKDFSINFIKHSEIETENATKPTFKELLSPIFTAHGVHPIYNYKGEQCEQIVNVPTRIMRSDEILGYLNAYTILPQETPPWEEIIYKLTCYSEILTEEYYDKIRERFTGTVSDLAAMFLRSEDDTDEHFFVSSPKIFEEKKGRIFHLQKPNRAHRKWVILDEYYDFKRNAWVLHNIITKRSKKKIELIDKPKPITLSEIARAKEDFLNNGGKITKIETNADWKNLEIHELANLIPFPSAGDRERLKEDVRLNGFIEPIVLFEGKVLDGRTRQGIGVELGIKPKYKEYNLRIPARVFVMAMGLSRRHLSSSQMAAIGVIEYLPEFEKEARNRMLMGGMEKIPEGSKGTASQLLADYLKTNEKYIRDAKSIKDSHPQFFEKILEGTWTISQAKTQITKLNPTKKLLRKTKFQQYYKSLLSKLRTSIEERQDLSNKDISNLVVELCSIYLGWNKRTEKKCIKKLAELEKKYSQYFHIKKNLI